MRRRQVALGLAAGAMVVTLVPTQNAAATAATSGPAGPTVPIPHSVWLYEPDASALPEAKFRVGYVLDQVLPANRQRMVDVDVRVHIIPQDQDLTDLPLWAGLRGLLLPDTNPHDSYYESRGYDHVRGLGPGRCSGPLDIAVGEELVVALTQGRYASPSAAELGWTLVHEVGHAVACSLTDDQRAQLAAAYTAARGRPLSEVVGQVPAYTVGDQQEYFAEGVVAWFEAGPNETYLRSWLAAHDPALHQLMSGIFAVPSAVPGCAGRRATTVLVAGGPPFLGTPGPDVIVGSIEDDVVNGGGGDDIICGLDGNDTLVGSSGSDQLLGGLGDDWLADTSGQDILAGGMGRDRLHSQDVDGTAPDTVVGGEDLDRCEHDQYDDVSECEPPAPVPTTVSTVSSEATATPSTGSTTTVRPPTTTTTTTSATTSDTTAPQTTTSTSVVRTTTTRFPPP